MNRANKLLLIGTLAVMCLVTGHILTLSLVPASGWIAEDDTHPDDPGATQFERTVSDEYYSIEPETVSFSSTGTESHIKHVIRTARNDANVSGTTFDDSLSSAARAVSAHRAEHKYHGITHEPTGTTAKEIIAASGECRGDINVLTRNHSTNYHTGDEFNRKTVELAARFESSLDNRYANETILVDHGDDVAIGVGVHIVDSGDGDGAYGRPVTAYVTVTTCSEHTPEYAAPSLLDSVVERMR